MPHKYRQLPSGFRGKGTADLHGGGGRLFLGQYAQHPSGMDPQLAPVNADQLYQRIAVSVVGQLVQPEGTLLPSGGDRALLVAEGGEALGVVVDQLGVFKLPPTLPAVHQLIGHPHRAHGNIFDGDLPAFPIQDQVGKGHVHDGRAGKPRRQRLRRVITEDHKVVVLGIDLGRGGGVIQQQIVVKLLQGNAAVVVLIGRIAAGGAERVAQGLREIKRALPVYLLLFFPGAPIPAFLPRAAGGDNLEIVAQKAGRLVPFGHALADESAAVAGVQNQHLRARNAVEGGFQFLWGQPVLRLPVA